MASDITTIAGKGNRKHRNVSTRVYRDGYDSINWSSGAQSPRRDKVNKFSSAKRKALLKRGLELVENSSNTGGK